MNWLILMLVTHKWYKAYITPRTPQRLYLEMAKHRSAYIFILMRENGSPSLCKLSSNWYEYKVHRDKMLTLKKIKRIINVLTGRKLIFFFSKRNSITKEENVHSLQGWVCLFVLLFVCGDDPFTLWSVLLHQLKYYWSSVTVSKLVLLWLLECLDSKIRP